MAYKLNRYGSGRAGFKKGLPAGRTSSAASRLLKRYGHRAGVRALSSPLLKRLPKVGAAFRAGSYK